MDSSGLDTSNIYDYLLKKKQLDDQQNQQISDDVIGKQNTNDMIGAISEALSAKSRAGGHVAFDQGFYDNRDKKLAYEGDQKRKDMRQQLEDVLMARNLQRTETLSNAEESRKAANFSNAQTEFSQAQNKYAQEQDPNSEQSKAYRTLVNKLQPGIKHDGSAGELKAVAPILESSYKVDQDTQAKRDAAHARKDEVQAKIEASKASKEDKHGLDQDKAYSELRSKLRSFRDNQVAKQAAMDTYSAAKAMDIVKGRDPNTLTTQDLSLLASEVAKIATGGVPTESGVQHLLPHNLSTKAAELQNFVLSKPSDAEAGEYIKRNMNYLNEMVHESKKVVSKFHADTMKGFKNRVKAEDLKEAQKDYQLDESFNSVEDVSSDKPSWAK